MATFAWHTSEDEEDYADALFELIKDAEAFGKPGHPGEAYLDGANPDHPTIGYGFRLDIQSILDAVIIKIFYPNGDRTTLLTADED